MEAVTPSGLPLFTDLPTLSTVSGSRQAGVAGVVKAPASPVMA